jgi:hypothetical protein
MNQLYRKHLIGAGLLALSAGVQAEPASFVGQDMDHPLSCCLASEWTLTAAAQRETEGPAPSRHDLVTDAQVPGTQECQRELGDLSCCIGAVWVLDEPLEPANAAAVLNPEAEPSEEFCCLASEYFAH